MAKLLDKSRHYSQIFGQTENGAIFHQDGIDYRGDGTPILDAAAEQAAAEQAAAEQAAAEQAAAEQAAAEQAAAEQAAAPKAKAPKAKVEASDDEDLA